jgi:hypothetical protein
LHILRSKLKHLKERAGDRKYASRRYLKEKMKGYAAGGKLQHNHFEECILDIEICGLKVRLL